MMDKELPFLDPDPIPEKYLRNPTWREEAVYMALLQSLIVVLTLLLYLVLALVMERA